MSVVFKNINKQQLLNSHWNQQSYPSLTFLGSSIWRQFSPGNKLILSSDTTFLDSATLLATAAASLRASCTSSEQLAKMDSSAFFASNAAASLAAFSYKYWSASSLGRRERQVKKWVQTTVLWWEKLSWRWTKGSKSVAKHSSLNQSQLSKKNKNKLI